LEPNVTRPMLDDDVLTDVAGWLETPVSRKEPPQLPCQNAAPQQSIEIAG
jgi:hypothetical protein